MEIFTRHYGGSSNTPSKIIDITVRHGASEITVDVTDNNGTVSNGFIIDLEAIVEELKDQNRLIDKLKAKQ